MVLSPVPFTVRHRPRTLGGAPMKKLRDIMRHGFLFTVQRGATVAEAARTMAANNVGIVAVLEGDRLARGLSPRDNAQKVLDPRLHPPPHPRAEGMTGPTVASA